MLDFAEENRLSIVFVGKYLFFLIFPRNFCIFYQKNEEISKISVSF